MDIIAIVSRRVNTSTGCGSAWLEHLVWDQGVAGSNPVTPMCDYNFIVTCGFSSMVEHQPSKLNTWVRFPSPAFLMQKTSSKMLEVFLHKKSGCDLAPKGSVSASAPVGARGPPDIVRPTFHLFNLFQTDIVDIDFSGGAFVAHVEF